MNSCIFCKIAKGDIPAQRFYEDDDVLVFPDVNPVAPVHLLIIPKRHFPTIVDMTAEAPELHAAMMRAVGTVTQMAGVSESGFRLIINTNENGGQEVLHVHMHILGGEPIGKMRCR